MAVKLLYLLYLVALYCRAFLWISSFGVCLRVFSLCSSPAVDFPPFLMRLDCC
eukprot:m.41928 g.41928  ORF g.41928 m.41928 type:complete len:53 (+) comp46275_c0_seq1:48-206(+)